MKEGESVGRSVVVSEPAKTDRPTDNSVNSVKTAIEQTGICAKLHDTPTRALLERITARLEGNPPECLKNRIHLRFDAITNLGMLEGLAADVAESSDMPVVDSTVVRSQYEPSDVRRRRELVAGLKFMKKLRSENG